MRCPSCGQENRSEGTRFCEKCGKTLVIVETQAKQPEPPSLHVASSPSGQKRLSRWDELGWAALAILLYLAIADAAVETFLSGSPLRWWIGGVTVAYLALCATIWRLMPKIWRHMD